MGEISQCKLYLTLYIMDTKGRILYYADIKGVKVSALERQLSLGRNYFRNTAKVSVEAVVSFLSVYSEVSPEWLLTGEGDMLKQSPVHDTTDNIIPLSHPKTPDKIYPMSEFNLYDIDVSAGLSRLFSEDGDRNRAYLGKISIPNMPKCDGAVKVIGDSMYPLLKSGDIIAYKEVHRIESVQYGEIYILQIENDSDVSVVVKYVKKSSEGNEYLNLVSYNKEHDPKDVKKESITAMARVILCIRQFSIM